MSETVEAPTPDGSWADLPKKKAAKKAPAKKSTKTDQVEAAKREAEAPEDELVAIGFRGETFYGIPSDQWSTLTRQAFGNYKWFNGVEGALGRREWLRFNELFPMPSDFDAFLMDFAVVYGFQTAGN